MNHMRDYCKEGIITDTTSNYEFSLPDYKDTMDVKVLDDNFTAIDKQLNALETDKADIKSPTFTGTPTAPTASSGTSSTQIATTAFVQSIASELMAEIKKIKSSIGNAYLSDVVESLTVEIIHIQYNGHSENEFYRYRVSGAQLIDGSSVDNSNGNYTDYGSRWNGGEDFVNYVIGFNPNTIIVLPVTAVTLEGCLYVNEADTANSAYKTVKVSEITGWSNNIDDGDTTYAIYETASITISIV